MAVDKRIPRVLNSDSDNKTADKVSMNDALNLYAGPDNEGIDDFGNKMDAGEQVLKNIRGNVAVESYPDESLPSGARVLGSVEDVKNDITYFFVYSANGGEHGVYAYDKNDILSTVFDPDSSTGQPVVRRIYRSTQFNFPQNGFVKGDIVYSAASRSLPTYMGDNFDKDVILYFTDGSNEPRKINTYRAFLSSGENIHGVGIANQYAEADFITACPKTPLKPIEFSFVSDLSRSISNFERTNGFQFAYQHIYKDGVESAISSYSDVAFPPSVIGQGANSFIDHTNFNKCILSIPECGPEIEKVRLLCRQGNAGSFLIIDEIDAGVTSYNFYNDRILKGVSTAEVNKQFDSVPRKAKAQTVSSNRLMYGNYLDGFNESNTVATATVIYKERPEDYLSFDVGYIPSIYRPSSGTLLKDENLAFFLDFSQMPDFLPGGTNVDISITVTPDRNFHLYTKTFSQTRQRGPQPLGADNDLFDGVNFAQSEALSDLAAIDPGGSSNTTTGPSEGKIWNPRWTSFDNINFFGNAGFYLNSWRYTGPSSIEGVLMDAVTDAAIGSSPAHPVVIKGGSVNFSASFFVPEDLENARTNLNKIVRIAFTNKNISSSTFDNSPNPVFYEQYGIQILENTAVSSYEFDLGLSSGDIIPQHYIGQNNGNTDPRNKLINAVAGEGKTNDGGRPIGFFIFNRGRPTFMLDEVGEQIFDPSGGEFDPYFGNNAETTSHFSLALVDFADGEPLTVIHDTASDLSPEGRPATGWIAISKEDLDQYGTNMNAWLVSKGIGTSGIQGFQNNPYGDNSDSRVTKGYGYQLGYLETTGQFSTDFSPLQPRYFYSAVAFPPGLLGGGLTPGVDINNAADLIIFYATLMDGEGGPGGGPARDENSDLEYDKLRMYDQGSVTVNPLVTFNEVEVPTYHYNETVFYGGSLRPISTAADVQLFGGGDGEEDGGYQPTVLPFLKMEPVTTQQVAIFNDNGFLVGYETVTVEPESFKYLMPFEDEENPGFLDPKSVTFKRNQSTIELTEKSINFYSDESDFNGTESFKTEANHNFGIVYYDERGRHGFVNYLTTAFVDGYSNLERGENKGGVEISLKLEGEPPSWAHSYKIVYGKNSTVEDFVQYISGGAYAAADPDDFEVGGNDSSNIYVSLNYLQGHPISYVSSFGARTPEGGLNMYKFQEGDKLRVISYFNGGSINYVSHEFEVANLVILGEDENPLASTPVPDNRKGQFLVLKDNPQATGFSFADIINGNHFWNNNCLIEVRTPKKSLDADEQIYYEVSDYYDVVLNPAGDLIHQTNPVVVSNGDVWFRPVAANVRNLEGGSYEDIILDNDGNDIGSVSNFVNVFMETESANDLFRSDSFSRGRPNAIFEDATETRREATITYSDPSNPESPKIRYSSFNASTANFKDLVETYGEIQYMGNHDPFVVVIQKEKISVIPVDKQILSDASGNQQLIASLNVLGEVITYGGVTGCDEDPSSVYDSGEEVYFCNKSLSKVYRFTRASGVEEISEIGMSSLIRASLKKAMESGEQLRLIGGFDALKEEYLFSIVNIPFRASYNVDEVLQPAQTVFPGAADDEDEDPPRDPRLVTNPKTVLDFGFVSEGDPITPRPVTIKNEGNEDLIITDFTVQDGEATEFELVSFNSNVSEANPMIIKPFKSEQILLSFLPTGVGNFSSFLSISSNDPNNPNFDLGLRILIQKDEPDGVAPTRSPFTIAYNELFGTDLNDEDMSADLAFDYLKELEGTPQEPTLRQLREFMDSAVNNETSVKQTRFDITADQLVDVFDSLNLFEVFGTDYVEAEGMFSGLIPATGSAPAPKAAAPPPSKPKPTTSTYFKSVDEAINYLFVQNELTIGEYHLLRAQINDNFSLNLNEEGPINNFDIIKFLQVFGYTTDPNDLAFESTPTPDQGGIPVGPTSLETILWLIDDATMTVGQYFYLASYVKLAAKADANEDNQVSTADLLVMLGVWGYGTSQAGTSYDFNDLAFNL